MNKTIRKESIFHGKLIIPVLLLLIVGLSFLIKTVLGEEVTRAGAILIVGSIVIITLSVYILFIMSKVLRRFLPINLTTFLLNNLTVACFLVIALILYGGLYHKLSSEFTITGVGAIIVFWYGYKKYEIEKEVKFLSEFQKGKWNVNAFDEALKEIFFLYLQYKKGYLSDDTWTLIEIDIDELIYIFLKENLTFNKENREDVLVEISTNIEEISHSLGQVIRYGYSFRNYKFLDYFMSRVEEINIDLLNKKGVDLLNNDEKGELGRITSLLSDISRKFNHEK